MQLSLATAGFLDKGGGRAWSSSAAPRILVTSVFMRWPQTALSFKSLDVFCNCLPFHSSAHAHPPVIMPSLVHWFTQYVLWDHTKPYSKLNSPHPYSVQLLLPSQAQYVSRSQDLPQLLSPCPHTSHSVTTHSSTTVSWHRLCWFYIQLSVTFSDDPHP